MKRGRRRRRDKLRPSDTVSRCGKPCSRRSVCAWSVTRSKYGARLCLNAALRLHGRSST
ncbi:hypothetical protein DENSPDRAFT_833425, partial [Dentipellis sp. KUC8613]